MNTNMIVQEELDHIPKDEMRGSDQNTFRQIYQIMRTWSFSESNEMFGKSRDDVFIAATKFLKDNYPDFEPKYDDKYFRGYE